MLARWKWPILLFACAVAWMAFVHLGFTAAVDRQLMLALRGLAESRSDGVTGLFRWLTWLGDADRRTPIILLAAAGLLMLGQRRAVIALPIAAYGATLTGNGLIKTLLARPRPDLVPWWTPADGYSLPSGHASGSVAFLLMLWLLTQNMPSGPLRTLLRLTGLALMLGIGASRPWLGVHWPSDIIAGWLWGGAFAAAAIIWCSPPAVRAGQTPS